MKKFPPVIENYRRDKHKDAIAFGWTMFFASLGLAMLILGAVAFIAIDVIPQSNEVQNCIRCGLNPIWKDTRSDGRYCVRCSAELGVIQTLIDSSR